MFHWSYKFCAKISQDKLIHINMKAFIQHVLLGIWALLFLYGKKKNHFLPHALNFLHENMCLMGA